MVEVVAEPSEVKRDAFSEIPAAATANATASSDGRSTALTLAARWR